MRAPTPPPTMMPIPIKNDVKVTPPNPPNIAPSPETTENSSNNQYTNVMILGVSIESK